MLDDLHAHSPSDDPYYPYPNIERFTGNVSLRMAPLVYSKRNIYLDRINTTTQQHLADFIQVKQPVRYIVRYEYIAGVHPRLVKPNYK